MAMLIEPVTPSSEEARLAGESSRKLAPLAGGAQPVIEMMVATAPGQAAETVTLPRGAVLLLVQLLTEMSRGNAVTLMPIQAQLTTQQAAEILGVSRPFIIKELRDGKLPFHRVGTHRRILFRDLMAYKKKCYETHDAAMDELVGQAQELKLGY